MELSYQNKWYTQPQASTSHVRSFERFSLKKKKKKKLLYDFKKFFLKNKFLKNKIILKKKMNI